MHRRGSLAIALSVWAILLSPAALAASGKEPPPPGAFKGAPPQYTRFTSPELTRGFMSLAFGSDLRIGVAPRGIRRFIHPITAQVVASGSVDRKAAMTRIVQEYARKVPTLHLQPIDHQPADVEVRLIDERHFKASLRAVFGSRIAREFIARTDPQCMTSVKSDAQGAIIHSVSFVIVDKGDAVFLDCAYHELLHAFGLSNHDQHNPWTMLNQKRMVGYLTVYDRDLLALLYDPRLRPGMTRSQVRRLLPRLIAELHLAAAGRR